MKKKRYVFPRELHTLEKILLQNRILSKGLVHNFYDEWKLRDSIIDIGRIISPVTNWKGRPGFDKTVDFLNSNAFETNNVQTLFDCLELTSKATEEQLFIFGISTTDLTRYQLKQSRRYTKEEKKIILRNIDLAITILPKVKNIKLNDALLLQLVWFFTDMDLGDITKAIQYQTQMKNPRLKTFAQAIIEIEKERLHSKFTDGWKTVQLISRESSQNSGAIKRFKKHNRPKISNQLFAADRQRIIDSGGLGISVNIELEPLSQLMQGETFDPIWNHAVPSKTKEYLKLRDKTERILLGRKKGGKNTLHPFFGGVISYNNRSDRHLGSAPSFGPYFLELDTNKVKHLSTFTYGDSFAPLANTFPFVWEDVIDIKTLVNLGFFRDEEGHGKIFEYTSYQYIETQIYAKLNKSIIKRICLSSQNLRELQPLMNHDTSLVNVIWDYSDLLKEQSTKLLNRHLQQGVRAIVYHTESQPREEIEKRVDNTKGIRFHMVY